MESLHVESNAAAVITWDHLSLKINEERIFIWSAEFHPFRLPVPDLWLDVFEKIRALGYNAVSFYVNWALLEGEPGCLCAEGIFALDRFCEDAKAAGLYLIARPGPYINAEVSGGGLPGWMQRADAALRTTDPAYSGPALRYTAEIAKRLAPYQITHGGAIIMYQVENEYSLLEGDRKPQHEHMSALKAVLGENGINVPTMFNDAKPLGTFAPGSGAGATDLYSWDGYPFGYGPGVTFCSKPSDWPEKGVPNKLLDYKLHRKFSPNTPFFLAEFQGSTVQGWGSDAPQTAAANLLNHEFVRLFYKEALINAVRIFNIYMVYGGTNWGNLGFPGTTTSYDEGAAISEERLVDREKYSEQRLIAAFVMASPALLTSTPCSEQSARVSSDNEQITITIAKDSQSQTRFYAVRHTDYRSTDSTSYSMTFETSCGSITAPQIGGVSLTLHGRDSKLATSDYRFGGHHLMYCTSDIFSHATHDGHSVLILYAGHGEVHEFALKNDCDARLATDTRADVIHARIGDLSVVQWRAGNGRRALTVSPNLQILLLSREEVKQYWAPVPTRAKDRPAMSGSERVLVKAGYLVRSVHLIQDTTEIRGDITRSTEIEIISAPRNITKLVFNGAVLDSVSQRQSTRGLSARVHLAPPEIKLPDLRHLQWKYHDSLPEIRADYDDSAWRVCDSPKRSQSETSVSLYGGDYGFHCGSLLFRGRFIANGKEARLCLTTQGGSGSAHSVWLDEDFVGSAVGGRPTPTGRNGDAEDCTYDLPSMEAGTLHVLTVLIDHMGYDMQFIWASESMKNPRGILRYALAGHQQSDVEWKITGNIGGESYLDTVRGPLNEGALFAERQGWHQPGAPTTSWENKTPWTGLAAAGVAFYTAQLALDLPEGFDMPLSFTFGEVDQSSNYRVQLFVNGYHYGKYISNLGPQRVFPVPEGILNHRGPNAIAVILWALDREGARLPEFALRCVAIIETGYKLPYVTKHPEWRFREGAY